jgi:hypothetical protein
MWLIFPLSQPSKDDGINLTINQSSKKKFYGGWDEEDCVTN